MNKIYKVIWSKVKHQYVVVSELAHSNGKQSRTSRNSIRSRIAALVVCGAIAAFGVFSALPNSAFAYPVKDPTVNEYVTADVGVAQAEKYQYVAIKTDENGETKTYTDSKHNEYNYHSETIGGTKYWVRDGYSLKIEYGNRYPDSASDKQVIAYKTTIDSNADKGLLRSDQLMIEAAKNSDNQAITSFTGYVLNDVTAGTYVGATNQGGTQTPDDWNYFIQDSNGKYVDVSSYSDDSGKHPEFVEAEKQADGTYTVYGNVVSTDNLYVIGEVTETKVDGGRFNPDTIKRDVHYRLGAFVTSEGEVYTGRVFGQTNEVLMTAKDENGEYYSYWAAPTDDPNAPITNMTMGQFNTAIKEIDDNTRGLAGDDIKQIDVKSNGGNAGGTIGLLRRGNYNKDTGKWEGTEYAPGTITVTSEGGTNDSGKANDVKIKFASENGGSFTVDAGSKVVANNGAGGTDLESISVNGQTFNVVGGAIAGQIDSEGNVKIQQGNKEPVTIGKVSDWNVKSGQINGSTLTLNTENAYDGNPKTGTVTIEGVASTNYVDEKDALNVKYDSVDKTSVTLGGANGTQIHNVADGTDTKDAVNLGQLKNNIYDKYLSTATINKENGTLDLTVTNGNGEGQSKTYNLDLKGYIGELDDYVDEVKISDDKQSLVLKRRNGTEMSVDIADLAGAGLSTSDYHLIGSGEDGTGTYSPDKDGNIELQVKDEKTGTISKVKLEDIASADDVAGNTSSITEINNTLANGVVKYDYDSETKQYKDSVTLKGENGSQIHNLADGTDTKDAVNLGQLSGKTGDLQYNTNHYVTNDEDLTVSIGKLDTQVYQNTTSITKLQGQTIDGGYVEDGVINLTHKNGDNTTKTVAQIDGLEDYTLQNGQFITKAKDENGKFTGATELTIADKYDPTKTEKVTIDGLVTYNTTQKLDETTGETIVTGIDYDNIRLAGENGTRITNLVDGWVDEKSTDAVNGSQLASVKDGAVKYWQNEDGSYDKSFVQLEGGEDGTLVTHVRDGAVNEYSSDAVNGSQLWETQQQIKDVETTANKHTIVSTTEDSNLTVKNVAEKGEADNYQVTLNDEVVLGDYFDKGNGVLISGNSGTISATNSITVGEDQGLVIDGQKKTIQGLSNTTWTGTTETPNRAATEGQLQNAYDGSVKYWRNEDGTYDKSFIQLEGGEEGTTITHLRDGVVAEHSTEAINGSQLWETQQQIKDVETTANKHTIVSTPEDSNLTVTNIAKNDEAANYQVALKDDITLKGDDSSIELNGTKGTIQVNQETAEGTDFTNINGNVVSIGYTNSEGTQNAIVIDGGKGTITGLSNTTWDDELAKQVANSEELQGTAATQGQLQQAVSEVAEVANAGWNAKAGGNTINVKPNETLNFEGDGNITVSATGGTSNELKFGLNDNITLGDKESTSITLYTDPTSETTVVGTDGNTTNVTGYVPESYKSGTGADFVKNNGGFALFTTDTQGHGIFGVTTKGTAHGKDFVTYTKDIYGNDTRYSLNDVGDAVAQMSSYYNEENRKSYTVFSRYLNEAEKDNPFVTVDEDGNKINATRDIPLALRDDGAVLIGATIKGEDFTDNGIRINAETETTYDEDGNEVTNNIATITGLENTEWTPPAPVATFANEGTETSRAATEAQLNDLYGTVVGYNVDTDGVNYGTVTLGGGRTSYDKDTHEGGTVLNNVAYASGTDGSEAVNVDYLNDAINNAVKDGGAISDSDRHLQEGTYHVNDQGEVELIVADEKGENRSTVTIDNIANKNDITNLDNKIDNTFNDLNDKINNIDNVETDVKGGNINEDGTISLKTENEDGTTTNVTLKGQLTDSGVVQEGTTFDKETGTLTITSQDKYSGKTSSVTVDGIASTDVVGVTTKEELADKYKAADEDGNATTAYITESESMVEADVALDHAIQDVAGTSYANDMVLSNRIDSVEKRLGNVEERIDKVGAMAAAIANLRTMGFDPEAPTEIAIGVGQYKSETGIAIGVFHYPNQDFMLSASLSSSGDELMGGIGATWKLGRKSAAERAKDEEARHLEQAEEMKKLAQQEKVKAQAQRHAKLLAERQQASQKNA